MDELIRLSKKAANEWRNTDAYYQAAVLIDSLCKRLEKIENRNPRTNADRIRAMSDEELRRLVRAFITNDECPIPTTECEKCAVKVLCFSGYEWIDREKEWLQQPAEEEGTAC